jgi:diguanylate cyclase (GGDEF)-like protein/PAS domain S-box-containing protein
MDINNDIKKPFSFSTLTDSIISGYFLSGVLAALLVWIVGPFIDAVFLQEGSIFQQLTDPNASELYTRSVISTVILIMSFMGSVLLNRSRQAEERTEKSEKMLSDAQLIAKFGSWELDIPTMKTYWSDSLYEIFGFDRNNIQPSIKSFFKVVYPDDLGTLKKHIFTKNKVDSPTIVEFRIIKPNKSFCIVQSYATLECDENKIPLRLIGTVQDITESKKSKEKLLFDQFAIENAGEAIYWIGPDGHISYANNVATNHLGYSKEELKSMYVYEFNTEYPKEKWGEFWLELKEKKSLTLETFHKKKDGTVFSVEITGNYLEYSGNEFACAFVRDITERKLVEDTLRESEAKYRLLADNVTDVVWARDMDMNVTYISPSFEKISGFSVEERMAQTLEQSMTPSSVKTVRQIVEEAFAREREGTADPDRSITLQLDMYRKDGSIYTVETIVSFVRNDKGEATGIVGIHRDITERKRAENKIARFARIFEDSLNEIYLFDTESLKFVQVNTAAHQNLGYTKEELQKLTPVDIKPQFTLEEFAEMLAPLLKGEQEEIVFETVHQRKDKSIYDVEVHLQLLKHEHEMLFVAIILDITERKRTEEALRIKQFAVDHAAEPIYWVKEDGRIYYVNNAACQSLGYSQEKLLSMYVYEIDADSSPEAWSEFWEDKFWEKMKDTGSKVFEGRHKTKSGKIFPVEIHTNFFQYQNEEYVWAYVNDITERKRTEEELRKLSRAVEASSTSLIITDLDGNIEYVNPKFTEITGYTKKEVVGENPRLLRSGETPESIYDELWDTVASGGEWKGELRNRKKDGSLYWSRSSISGVKDAHGDITHYIAIQDDVTHEYELSEQLSYQASHDALTGLINRREFERRAERLFATIRQDQTEHALSFMDLDQFKVVNDTCGHTAGDELLRQLSILLQQKVRKRDTLARLGGDEFGILMEHCSLDHANRVATTLQRAVQDFQFVWEEHSFKIGVSIGLVAITEAIPNLTELLKEADAACYVAKDMGRNRIHVYHGEDTEMTRRHGEMQWVARLHRALNEDRFCLYAQPIVPLDSRTDKHYELLIRMKDEKGEIILPGAFLPAAERYNLITQLDHWVIGKSFELLKTHPAFVKQISFISINVSSQSLADESCLDFIITQMSESGIDGDKICFEITETAAISNLGTAIEFISTLKGIGCRFALDDFGSGFSSFGYLKNLPVDYLKIDGMFVKDIVDDQIDHAMVKSINEIGQVMGMQTIAEFVENDEIKGMLREIGVNYAQGYGIGSPLAFDELLGRSSNVSELKK